MISMINHALQNVVFIYGADVVVKTKKRAKNLIKKVGDLTLLKKVQNHQMNLSEY